MIKTNRFPVIPIVGLFAFNEHGELLLLQRHSEDLGGGQWGTPGGRIDPGEEAYAAIQREVYEETAIEDLKLTMLGSHLIHMPHGTVHMTSYTANISSDTNILLDPDEHHAYAWFKLEGLLEEDNILWGIPTILRDFGLFSDFDNDPTLADGSSLELLK